MPTTPHRRRFTQVDVFTDRPLLGNPVAVVLDGDDLPTETMLDFTSWTNLSEATFVLPPTHGAADYRVRIFCPGRELPFAGHPTLGTASAWLEAGGVPQGAEIIQECGAGLVRIRRAGEVLSFAAPPLQRSGPLPEANVDLLVHGLGLQREDVLAHQWCDNGPGWQALLLASRDTLMGVTPARGVLDGLDIGLIAVSDEDGIDAEVRAFFPGNAGLTEDPVTGSLNAALAQWLIPAGILPQRWIVQQGTALGRAGRVHIEAIGDDIWIGGNCLTVIDGTVSL